MDREQKEGIKKYFNKISDEYGSAYDPVVAGSLRTYIFLSRRDNVINLLEKCSGRVLDIGCGPGVFMEKLLDKSYDEVWGIDISESMVNGAKKRTAGMASSAKLHFGVGDIEKLDFADNYFDSVLCIGVLEYLHDDWPALKEIRRVLKPGGEAVFSVPNTVSPFILVDKFIVIILSAFMGVLRAVGVKIKIPQNSLLFSSGVKDKYYLPFRFNVHLSRHGFKVDRTVFHIYRLAFLNAISQRLSVSFVKSLEWLSNTPFSWMGINYIVRVRKE